MKKITRLIDSLEGAYAPNTIRSYRSDYMHYSNWCHKYQYDPFNIQPVAIIPTLKISHCASF